MRPEDQLNPPNPLWDNIAPLLDEALAQLREKDRQAVLLRYFENKNLSEVGSALGAGEDATRMRINRALEKLHRYFTKRGVISTSAIIAAVISANSVQAAPIVTVKTITAVAVAKGAAAGSSSLTLAHGAIKLMAWAKAKTAILVSACALLAAGTPIIAFYEINKPVEGIPKGWSVLDGTAEQWHWADGKISAESTSWETILASTKAYRDFTLSAIASTTNREASLAFRMQDAENGYLVIFAPAGTPYPLGNSYISLVKKTLGQETRLAVYNGRLFSSLGQSAKVEVTAKGSWFEVRLNETTVLRVKDTTFPSGLIGLRIFGEQVYPCDSTFSNLVFSGTTTDRKKN